jgi:hypothetical protein
MPKPLDVRHVSAWSLPACRIVTLASNVFGACVWVRGSTLVHVEVGRWRLLVVRASVYACSRGLVRVRVRVRVRVEYDS